MLRKFLRSDGGSTAVEYGLIAVLIVVAGLVALMAFADTLDRVAPAYIID